MIIVRSCKNKQLKLVHLVFKTICFSQTQTVKAETL